MTIEQIAKTAHELNKAYCASLGDHSQPSWEDAPDWQKDSAIRGVQFHLNNPTAGPEASHEAKDHIFRQTVHSLKGMLTPAPIFPQAIKTVVEKATYEVPLFRVTDAGLEQYETSIIRFCKGNKADATTTRQGGFFTETLIAVCVQYLKENNVGELASRETSTAITQFEQGLLWLGKRAADRQARGVQGTYQK